MSNNSPESQPFSNTLPERIKRNLNPYLVLDILKGGPERINGVISDVISGLHPTNEAQRKRTYNREITSYQKILEEIKIEQVLSKINDNPENPYFLNIVSLPKNPHGACLCTDESELTTLDSTRAYDHFNYNLGGTYSHPPDGKYILVYSPTSVPAENRFDNGFFGIKNGEVVTHQSFAIENSDKNKGGLSIIFNPNSLFGQIRLLSPQKLRHEIANPELIKNGVIIGCSLYFDDQSQDSQSIVEQSAYFESINHRFGFLLESESGLYFGHINLFPQPGYTQMANVVSCIRENLDGLFSSYRIVFLEEHFRSTLGFLDSTKKGSGDLKTDVPDILFPIKLKFDI